LNDKASLVPLKGSPILERIELERKYEGDVAPTMEGESVLMARASSRRARSLASRKRF
jgi:hypothetical protein